jgi:4-amino-4-deoxy-L-arabinose transferase-like glycosyltransferase
MKINKIILIFILFLAGFLRFYKIGSYPPINADEASIGYNAYSLLQTGKDEHGNGWPIHFKSFNDYKPGGYFYLVIPFIYFFGLTTFSVRLPAIIVSILTIYLVYRLANFIWSDRKLGLIWAFLLSISPWHLHFSRGGWESNTAVFFITLGVYLLLLAVNKNREFSIFNLPRCKAGFQFSIFSLIASMYVYHSARIIAPLLFLGLTFLNFKTFWNLRNKLIIPILIGFLFIIPLSISFLRGGAASRFSGVGLLADSGPFWRVNELRGEHKKPQSLPVRIMHNQYLEYCREFAENYLSHFDFNFLLISGDEVPRSKVPGIGVMHLVSGLFLPIGAWYWIKNKVDHKYFPVIFILVSPIASAMTFQAPSALRSLAMVIPLTFFTAYGIKICLKVKQLRLMSGTLLIIGYTFSLVFWFNAYFVDYFQQYPTAWPLGYKEAVEWMEANPHQDYTIITEHDQPYILTAFYIKYPPKKMQQEIKLTPPDEFGFSTVRQFGRFKFRDQPPANGTIVKEFNATKIYDQN